MKDARLFVFLTATVGVCALLGSVLGAAVMRRGVFVGGFVGGLLGSCAAVWFARRLLWIPIAAAKATALGTALGFLAAAAVAIVTIRTPVGPILSTLLIGSGGLLGLRLSRPRSDSSA